MTTPRMHCANPNCVDDNCHGECLTLTAESDDCCGNSCGCSQEAEESPPFQERREEYIAGIIRCN
jgi:hypothetical protein